MHQSRNTSPAESSDRYLRAGAGIRLDNADLVTQVEE
jgi:hypothetical protein